MTKPLALEMFQDLLLLYHHDPLTAPENFARVSRIAVKELEELGLRELPDVESGPLLSEDEAVLMMAAFCKAITGLLRALKEEPDKSAKLLLALYKIGECGRLSFEGDP